MENAAFLSLCVALAAAGGGASFFSLDRLIFFPDPVVGSPPPGVEERWLQTEDGVRLHAWYVPGRSSGPTLLWSHGNAGNIDGRVEVALALARRGLNVLAYDYRGYGKSSGYPSEQGVYLDARAGYHELLGSGMKPSQIICFGESLGGAVSIHLAAERKCAAVVVVSTFTRMKDVASHHYGPLGVLAGNRFDSLPLIGSIGVPILVAHGDADEVVPFRLGKELYDAAPQPKRFVTVAGAHHNDILGSEVLLDEIAQFVRSACLGGL